MTQDDARALLRLLKQYSDLGIREQIDFEKFYLYSIVAHSTAIEGSTVTEVEAQLLFDDGITSARRNIVEQNMNIDLKSAYDYGIRRIAGRGPITVEFLVALAAKVMARTGGEYHAPGGDFDALRGELRRLNVTAGPGGRSYVAFQKVPARLDAFCAELNRRRKVLAASDVVAIYELSFWAHFELVSIHPWADGNGRMSRLLMNLIQMEFGLLPSKVLREDKAEYIQALADAREQGDVGLFADSMTRLHIRHLQAEIEQYRKSIAG